VNAKEKNVKNLRFRHGCMVELAIWAFC